MHFTDVCAKIEYIRIFQKLEYAEYICSSFAFYLFMKPSDRAELPAHYSY